MNSIKKGVVQIAQNVLGYLDDRLSKHGERVAYFTNEILKHKNIDEQTRIDVLFACLFHDIGAYKTEDVDNILQFETSSVQSHSIYGYLYLKYLSPIGIVSECVLYHHTPYEMCGKETLGLLLGQILHVIDRIDLYRNEVRKVGYREFFNNCRSGLFDPEIIEMIITKDSDYHILDSIIDGSYEQSLMQTFDELNADENYYWDIIRLIAYTIDFKSEYTVAHNIVIEMIVNNLANYFGFTLEEIKEINFAAIVHDLGKIAIDTSILESTKKLTDEEMQKMKMHVSYTEKLIRGFLDDKIVDIAVHHHEKLDGSGYPRGLKKTALTIQDQILAVSDIVSALYGKRSYKGTMERDDIIAILKKEVAAGKLSKLVVDTISDNYEKVMSKVESASNDLMERYKAMLKEYEELME